MTTNYIKKIKLYKEIFSGFPQITSQLDQIVKTAELLSEGTFGDPLQPLDLTEEMAKKVGQFFLETNPEVAQKRLQDFFDLDELVSNFRDYLIEEFGMFNYVSLPWIKDLSTFIGDNDVVEIMAGNGYISAGLSGLNPNRTVIATDNFSWEDQDVKPHPVYNVMKMEAILTLERYIQKDDPATVIMAWAPDTSTADLLVLEYLRHSGFFNTSTNQFIVVGEKNGATNSPQFWRNAVLDAPNLLNRNHQSFDLIHDKVFSVQ